MHSSRILILFALVLLPVFGISPETIFFKNGQVIVGTVIGQTRENIRVADGTGVKTFHKSDIQRISYDSMEDVTKKEARRRQEEEVKRQMEALNAQEDLKKKQQGEQERLARELNARRQEEERGRREREEAFRTANLERLHHKNLESERIRLQHTTGMIHLTGDELIDGLVMRKTDDRLSVRTSFGSMILNLDDIESMTVREDDGDKVLSPQEIRGVVEDSIQPGEMQLSGGEIIKVETDTRNGETRIRTNVGILPVEAQDVRRSGTPLPESKRKGILLKEGQSGLLILAGSGEKIPVTLLKRSNTMLIFRSAHGELQLLSDEVQFAGPAEEGADAAF